MKKIVFLFLLATIGIHAQTEVVKFSANIANRNSDTIFIKGKNFKQAIPINKKGEFESSFSAPKGIYQMTDGVEYTQLYLVPGFDLKLNMDAKRFDESIVYKGKGEKENNYLAQLTVGEEKFESLMDKDEATFKAAVTDFQKKNLETLKDPAMDVDFRNKMELAAPSDSMSLYGDYYKMQSTKKLQGNSSPTFDYVNFKGGKTKLSDFKGKYVYIDTWATWCGPCRAEIPFLQKTEEKYKGKNIEFVSISVDVEKDFEKWKKMVADKSLGGTQLFADNNWNSEFIKAFGINSIPRFILIGPDGKVVSADAERPSSPELSVTLDKLLK